MGNIFVVLLTIIFLQNSAQAADRLRIGFSELIASYSSLPLGQKRGFFQEEGLQAEFIRMGATVGLATLVTGEILLYIDRPRGCRSDPGSPGQNRGLLRAWPYRYAHRPA